MIEHHTPIVVEHDYGYVITNADVFLLDDHNAFKWMSGNWLSKGVNLRAYAVWAGLTHGPVFPRQTDPHEIPEPNAIMPVGYNLVGSDVIHTYIDCRYLTGKEPIEVDTVEFLMLGDRRVCAVCAKRDERTE